MPRFRRWLHDASLLLGIAVIAAAFALALQVSTQPAALAHAAYKTSIPLHDTVVKTDPTSIHITFLQALDPKGLVIQVYDNKGVLVSTGTAAIDPSDANSASIGMKGDGSDIYRVDWQTVSAEDGDPTLGAFIFGVDPSGQNDKVPQLQAPSTTSTGTPAIVSVLTGVLGLILGAAVVFFLTRSRPATKS